MCLSRRLFFRICFVFLAAVASGSSVAFAMVTQPNNDAVPQPTPAAEISVITSRGFPADADTLAGLFKYHAINGVMGGDATIDPVRDAQITPGTFSPQCGLTGTLVDHGGGCKNALGWYNATEPATMPAANQIYTLVPANLQPAPPNGLSCQDNDFCPLATMMTTQTGQHTWVNYDFAQNIRTSPNYKGGLIGLAMIGNPGMQCPQTKYSQADLNDKDSVTGKPWITTLIYQSVADPQSYYIAFEDQATCALSWRGCTGPSPNQPGNGNDGDFNDFVFFVSGLSCNLGGDPCTVPGAMGICAGGVTECAAGGMTTQCRQTVMPTTEVCDNIDNDCNGMVDDGANLCPNPGDVCTQGVCRHPCDNTEFPCAVGLACDADGLCKDPACIGKTCGANQVCRGGTCVGGCDGVTCPHGQRCQLGNCVSACDGVMCPSDRVCENGACQPPCNNMCRTCKAGTTCNMTSGVCVETGCQNKTCPSGQVCVAGNCQDGCTGVTCPGGQQCMNGSCTPVAPPDAGAPAGSGGGGGFSIVGTGGAGGSTSVGTGGSGTSTGTGTGSAGATGQTPTGKINTCNCEVAQGPGAAGVALLLAGVVVAAGRRRRRAAAGTRRT